MAVFRCVPPGTVLELHPAPLQCPAPGRSKQATASKRIFKAGDVMLADDTTGEGHRSRVLGNVPHIFMTVPLGD